ncbi:hypothetical protein LJC46_01975 [Desulfovibrio sp. OttesenSCG-928-G15]|nr:hypothetical protein [Desulfovibrio sp. OttesenSCG-928-G15]
MDFLKMSYSAYECMLDNILASKKYTDFSDANSKDSFIVLRHDVEFSVDRAYTLSLIEQKRGIAASYFFQLTSNMYNVFSRKNISLIEKILKMGHKIGLHYSEGDWGSVDDVVYDIKSQVSIFSNIVSVDRFSFHRPSKNILKRNITIDGLINVYGDSFFTPCDCVTDDTPLHVKYISDSRHRWNYGHPTLELFSKYKRVHILVHPDTWTSDGLDNMRNFRALMDENRVEFKESLVSECEHFKDGKNEF